MADVVGSLLSWPKLEIPPFAARIISLGRKQFANSWPPRAAAAAARGRAPHFPRAAPRQWDDDDAAAAAAPPRRRGDAVDSRRCHPSDHFCQLCERPHGSRLYPRGSSPCAVCRPALPRCIRPTRCYLYTQRKLAMRTCKYTFYANQRNVRLLLFR